MSTTTAPSAPPVTVCGVSEGIRQMPPGSTVFVSSPTRKTTDPSITSRTARSRAGARVARRGFNLDDRQRELLAVDGAGKIALGEQLRRD
jgi:hypothetical protein